MSISRAKILHIRHAIHIKGPFLSMHRTHSPSTIREIYKPFYETTVIHKWIGYCCHVDVIVYTCFHGKGTV